MTFWCGEMLGNNFLCKLVNNVKNLSTVFDEIYPADSSIIIKKYCNIDVLGEKELERGPKRRSESSQRHMMMEWSHKLGKSSDDVCPFDTTHTQTQLKITMVRFA